jgi:hypothetical protein
MNMAEIMHEVDRVQKLHKKRKAAFLEWIDTQRDAAQAKVTATLLKEDYKAAVEEMKREQRLASSWHWIWCGFGGASVTILKDIVPEHWELAKEKITELEQEQEQVLQQARDHKG